MRKETIFRKSPRKSSGSSAAKPRRRAEAPLGERLLDSMTELRAHLRGEIQLSETVYHVPPETDVRALRETLGLSHRTSPPYSASTCAPCRTGSRAGGDRRSPSVPTWPSSSVTRRPSSGLCAPPEPKARLGFW